MFLGQLTRLQPGKLPSPPEIPVNRSPIFRQFANSRDPRNLLPTARYSGTVARRNSHDPMKTLLPALATTLTLIGGAANSFAQTASTVPVGAVSLTIAAGTGTTKTITPISIPLLQTSESSGQLTGRITAISANSISNSNANWTAGALSSAASPHLVRITSGSATGLTLLISTSSQNTASTLTIDSEDAGKIDLSSLGILTGATGDTYEIVQCDTLLGFFGSPSTTGITGGSSANNADTVQVFVSGAWRIYYYSNDQNRWNRVGPNTVSDNIAIRPDTVVLYNRLGASPINLTVLGTVPAVDRKSRVATSGLTPLSTFWPSDSTLGSSAIHQIPGWITASNPANADIVQIMVSGAWRSYYHNGTQWLRVGPNTPSNSVVLPTSGGVLLSRKGTAGQYVTLAQTRPYNLD